MELTAYYSIIINIISQTANPTSKANCYEPKGTSKESIPVRKRKYKIAGQIYYYNENIYISYKIKTLCKNIYTT